MPLIGIFIRTDTFASMSFHLGNAEILFGNFIAAIVNFLIMALVLFCIIRTINRLYKKKETPAAPPVPSKEELLLIEIRDLLKAQNR
jgi:large conductance mechanosensitive channel